MRSGTGPTWSMVTSTSRTPSNPRTGRTSAWVKYSSAGRPVTSSITVRRAASMTPPVAPKMTPEPVAVPKGLSKSEPASAGRSMPRWRIIFAASRVVRAMSTSGRPSRESSGRAASNFLAVQGMRETETTSAGSRWLASAYQVLMSAPNICCGERHVDMCGSRSG
nr:hypothetical protein [Georgenia muralis]